MNRNEPIVLVTGGAGYVGAVLVPKLLQAGWRVRVLDWYLYGRDVLDDVADDPRLEQHEGDLRDPDLVARRLRDCRAVVHLACISNDPSSDLNPALTRSVNLDAFAPLVHAARDAGVRRFVYASSSSVYGISDRPIVDEDHPLAPLTDYSRYKAWCEPILLEQQSPSFVPVIVRPATVCGASPRQRFDVVVNLLTAHAACRGQVTVFGGRQMRPNLHIEDMTDLYVQLLSETDERVAGEIFNVGAENLAVADIAQRIRDAARGQRRCLPIVTRPTEDERSYRISSDRIKRHLGFVPRRTVDDAIADVLAALREGRFPGATDDPRYHNVRMMAHHQHQLMEPATV
ncbi:MAG: UDP-glucose 4-epimerase [Phycisphaeraceae bacterium]|nr:UDP-glucose 4-epimerase [Phycisphaeraceae bacterium]